MEREREGRDDEGGREEKRDKDQVDQEMKVRGEERR